MVQLSRRSAHLFGAKHIRYSHSVAAATGAAALGPTLDGMNLLQSLAQHTAGLFTTSTYSNLGMLSMSPLGTVAALLLSYNLSVVGLKHLWYSVELTCRDYLQDTVLVQWWRYAVLWMLLICVEQLLIEV